MQIRPLSYALGAEITGIDLAAPIAPGTAREIKEAWERHSLLCFPEQDLAPSAQTAFAALFGEVDVDRTQHLAAAANPGISYIANKQLTIAEQRINPTRADAWHSDLSFSDRPGTATFLLAKQLPDVGGDTMFSNTYLAYETLSPAYAALVDGLEAVHDVRLTISFPIYSPELQAQRVRDFPQIVHPLVRVHPETGRKALFIGATLRRFAGMTDEETHPVHSFLMEHATRYEFTYRHRWHVGDLVMWDNRCTMHYAVPDFAEDATRNLQRCTLIAPRSGEFLHERQGRAAAAV